MSKFVIKEVQIAEVWDRLQDLLRANWAETGFDFEFAPSKDIYEKLQAARVVLVVVAENAEGEIVGYSSAFVYRHHFNQDVIFCGTDALFISPPYRHGTLTRRIMQATEKAAAEGGATRIIWHTRAGTRFAEVLSNHGYTPVDVCVMKELKHGC